MYINIDLVSGGTYTRTVSLLTHYHLYLLVIPLSQCHFSGGQIDLNDDPRLNDFYWFIVYPSGCLRIMQPESQKFWSIILVSIDVL